MSKEIKNQFLHQKANVKTSNIFLMSLQNDNNIKNFLEAEKNDSSDEEDEKNMIDKNSLKISLKNFQEENNLFRSLEGSNQDMKSIDNINNIDTTNKDEFTNDLSKNLENNKSPRKSLLNRLIGPIDAGSIRGSIFNLSIFSLGSGCLALPQKIQHMSIVVTVIDIILSGLATYWTLNLMLVASRRLKNCFNYAKVVELLYGKKLSNFLVFTILLYTFGIMILYQVIAYKLIGAIINDIGNYGYEKMDDFVNDSFWNKYIYKFCVMYGVLHVILLPLCLLKDMSKLRFSSIFGVLSLLFVMIIILIQFPEYLTNYLAHRKEGQEINIFDISKGFGPDLLFFKGTATIFYSFNCHVAAFPILKNLKDGVNRRIQKVFRRSLILDAAIYFLIGICGYLSCPIDTPDLIIERKKLGESDYLMTVGRFFFLCTLLMKLPASYISFRITLLSLLDYKEDEVTNKMYKKICNSNGLKIYLINLKLLFSTFLNKFRNYMITLPTLYISCLISILYQSISDYISLLGSFNSVIIGFILPGK